VQILPAGPRVWSVPAGVDLEVSVAWEAADLPLPRPQRVRLEPGESRPVKFGVPGSRRGRIHALDATGAWLPCLAYVWRLDGAGPPRPWSRTTGTAEEHPVTLTPGRYGVSVRSWDGGGWLEVEEGAGVGDDLDLDVRVEPSGERLRAMLRVNRLRSGGQRTDGTHAATSCRAVSFPRT
jgi:hypothetical protein